jgi:hypothetical protein
MQSDPTATFIDYFASLLECKLIGEQELSMFVHELINGRFTNPIHENNIIDNTPLKIHYDYFQCLIHQNNIDLKKLLSWSMDKINQMNNTIKNCIENCKWTQQAYHKMVFNSTGPRAFEMMSTLVTQMHWSMIMGENPSHFVNGDYKDTVIIKNRPIKMQPDNPVECVNSIEDERHPCYGYSVFAFLKKLNEPLEEGNLILESLIQDHQKGDYYRLPTEAEWEYVVRDLFKINRTREFEDSEANLEKYARHHFNSDWTTYPVTEKSSLTVDGRQSLICMETFRNGYKIRICQVNYVVSLALAGTTVHRICGSRFAGPSTLSPATNASAFAS